MLHVHCLSCYKLCNNASVNNALLCVHYIYCQWGERQQPLVEKEPKCVTACSRQIVSRHYLRDLSMSDIG